MYNFTADFVSKLLMIVFFSLVIVVVLRWQNICTNTAKNTKSAATTTAKSSTAYLNTRAYSVLNVNKIRYYTVNSFYKNYENQISIMAFRRNQNIVVLLCMVVFYCLKLLQKVSTLERVRAHAYACVSFLPHKRENEKNGINDHDSHGIRWKSIELISVLLD